MLLWLSLVLGLKVSFIFFIVFYEFFIFYKCPYNDHVLFYESEILKKNTVFTSPQFRVVSDTAHTHSMDITHSTETQPSRVYLCPLPLLDQTSLTA